MQVHPSSAVRLRLGVLLTFNRHQSGQQLHLTRAGCHLAAQTTPGHYISVPYRAAMLTASLMMVVRNQQALWTALRLQWFHLLAEYLVVTFELCMGAA
jgi:hypothetical protein